MGSGDGRSMIDDRQSPQLEHARRPGTSTAPRSRTRPSGTTALPGGPGAELLRLQRLAGNRAVTSLVALQRAKAGTIKKGMRLSNTIHWYQWAGQGFVRQPATADKGLDIAQARPTPDPEYAWVELANGRTGYLRRKNLDVTTWGPQKQPEHLDSSRLLTAHRGEAKPIESANQEWHLNQAFLMEAYRKLKALEAEAATAKDKGKQQQLIETQKQLALAMLQSFSKSAGLSTQDAGKKLNIQTTAFMDKAAYHRSQGQNTLLRELRELIAKDQQLDAESIRVLSDPLFAEVLAREFSPYRDKPPKDVPSKIGTADAFRDAVRAILDNLGAGHPPVDMFALNVTPFFDTLKIAPADIQTRLSRPLEEILVKEVAAYVARGGDRSLVLRKVAERIQLVLFTKVKGVDVLVVPKLFEPLSAEDRKKFSDDEASYFEPSDKKPGSLAEPDPKHVVRSSRRAFLQEEGHAPDKLESAMIESGARLDPIATKKAMLEFAAPEDVLAKAGITLTALATASTKTPTVFPDVHAFLSSNIVNRFAKLSSKKDAPPYLAFYPKATVNLLNGLGTVTKGGGIDAVFRDKGIPEVLQTAYFRIINAMASGIDSQQDLVKFLNSIELIHDQLQMILAVAEPHDEGVTFSKAILKALHEPRPQTGGGEKGSDSDSGGKRPDAPTVPGDLSTAVHHKASAMHSVASILSGVEATKEAQSGNRNVRALVLKDNYYEAHGAVLEHSRTYTVDELNGWKLQSGDRKDLEMKDDAFSSGKMQPEKPFDIFICDFHHNISVERSEYRPENVTHQVDQLFEKKLVADRFTVAIDCTVDFLKSDDIRDFLQKHKARIEAGKLNVVLYRSAQKFDMMGLDNYYGGFTVTINDGKSFKEFDDRISKKEDQVTGLAHQGMAHLASFGAEDLDEYRRLLMRNTDKLYKKLTSKGLGDSSGALYIGKTEDPNNVFLDIQLPGAGAFAGKVFSTVLTKWTQQQGMPMTSRPSFGFATSNLTSIAGSKIRLNPGLDSEATLDKYAAFFEEMKTRLTKAKQEFVVYWADKRKEADPSERDRKFPDPWPQGDTDNEDPLGRWYNRAFLQGPSKAHEEILPVGPRPTVDTKKELQIKGPTVSSEEGRTEGLKKVTKSKGGGSGEPSKLPKPEPLRIADLGGANPYLYFKPAEGDTFNLVVSGRHPGEGWELVEQFCAVLSLHWLAHGQPPGGLRFADLGAEDRVAAVDTLVRWSAGGLAAQEQAAITALGGARRPPAQVATDATEDKHRPGTRFWYGPTNHALAAVKLPDGKYLCYDPNTGATEHLDAGEFAKAVGRAPTVITG